jgi:MFS family permease
MVGTFAALALGQLLIGQLPIESSAPFDVIVAFFACALVIVSMTRAEAPAAMPEARLPYGELTKAAPLAVLGVAASGMAGATVYAVIPMWLLAHGAPQGTIGLVMLSIVLGGLAFQVPVGRLSDRVDRRALLGLLAFGFALSAVTLAHVPRTPGIALPVAAVLGGFMATLYPVCVSHALDHMTSEKVLSVSGRLVLVNGIGSAIGPFVGSWIMFYLDLHGVLYFIAGTVALVSLTAALKVVASGERPLVEAPAIVVAPQAVQVNLEPSLQPSMLDQGTAADREPSKDPHSAGDGKIQG